jgi:hypothetical protein|tara:strand:- start:692 stop:1330 length:639 start_codon:yes stop_codon:yes gene_type:complete
MAYTFTTLKQAIQDYTENTETTFVNNLSRFIQNAEERLYRTLQIPSLRRVVDSTLVNGQRFLNKPADFQYIYSIAVKEADGDYVFLLDKDSNFLREAFPNTSTTGFPQYYANHNDEHFMLAPTPNSAYAVQLHYAHDPTSITTSSDGTSWLGTNAEVPLLYGSLIEANIFMKGDADVTQMYENKYQEAIALLAQQTEGRLKRDSYRDGEVRV